MDKKNLRNKKGKKRLEKGLSLLEIFILIASIGAFSYFLGDEFRFVSANNNAQIEWYEESPATSAASSSTPTVTDVSQAAIQAAQGATTTPILTIPTPPVAATGGTDIAGAVGTPAGVPTGVSQTASSSSLTLEQFGKNIWSHIGDILINAAIAAALYYGTKWIGSLICPTCSDNFLNSLGLALSLGYGIGSGLGSIIAALGGPSLAILGPVSGFGLIGIGVGIILFLIFYRDVQISSVVFTCYPWQPVTGGSDCDKCNKGDFPCTQYKCQSLGQSCELLNPGTSNELCTWVNRNDIAPPVISAWTGPLDTKTYEYIPDTARLPPDKGVIIKDKLTSDGCIPPFTKLYYGISLDKPGMCKADVVRTDSFSNMSIVLSNGYYLYNHTLLSIHAGTNESSDEGISLPNGGNYQVFVRCQSRNGYANLGTFAFKYCVSNEQDTTPPTIELTNPINGMPVQFGTTSMPIQLYTDKPADCRWSHSDEDYNTMAGTMQCSQSITDINANMLYKCTTTLTGLKDSTTNTFYFRCNSYPSATNSADRFKNEVSKVYTLIGTQPLVIDSISPITGTTITNATLSVEVTLQAQTSAGYNNGEAKCYFKKTSESDKSYVLFANTNSYQSSQNLWFPMGDYAYTIKCCDLGGNCATKETSFTVTTDFEPPVVVRAYNEGGQLDIITDKTSQCVYDTNSCSYDFANGIKMTSLDGISHLTNWDTTNNFYIKCQDSFGNVPAPDQCSITIRPYSGY